MKRGDGTINLPEATGGNGALTYTLTPPLPNGLTFNAAQRQITGIPEAAQGEALHTYTATDSDINTAATDTASLTLTIIIAPRMITGKADGAVTDDTPGADFATGKLTLPGGFMAQTGVTDYANGLGAYGDFILSQDSEWIYTLHTDDPATNHLGTRPNQPENRRMDSRFHGNDGKRPNTATRPSSPRPSFSHSRESGNPSPHSSCHPRPSSVPCVGQGS